MRADSKTLRYVGGGGTQQPANISFRKATVKTPKSPPRIWGYRWSYKPFREPQWGGRSGAQISPTHQRWWRETSLIREPGLHASGMHLTIRKKPMVLDKTLCSFLPRFTGIYVPVSRAHLKASPMGCWWTRRSDSQSGLQCQLWFTARNISGGFTRDSFPSITHMLTLPETPRWVDRY